MLLFTAHVMFEYRKVNNVVFNLFIEVLKSRSLMRNWRNLSLTCHSLVISSRSLNALILETSGAT